VPVLRHLQRPEDPKVHPQRDASTGTATLLATRILR
jgi:hypothetical protein